MRKQYYNSFDEMKETALSYRQDWFRVEHHTAVCECGDEQSAFTIYEREGNDIIEKMVCCSKCVKNQILT